MSGLFGRLGQPADSVEPEFPHRGALEGTQVVTVGQIDGSSGTADPTPAEALHHGKLLALVIGMGKDLGLDVRMRVEVVIKFIVQGVIRNVLEERMFRARHGHGIITERRVLGRAITAPHPVDANEAFEGF